ncbi:zinc-dependent peptidase [soil metagenome]
MIAYWLFLAAAVTIIVILIGQPIWKARRRRRRMHQELPSAWGALLEAKLPLYTRLPKSLRPRLHGLINAFLAEKTFIGCAGQEIDDEIRLLIAAQACLLVFNRKLGFFEELQAILVYPTPFLVDEEFSDAAGVVTNARHELQGQAWDAHQIVLSRDDVLEDSTAEQAAQNVVLHEFAHQLDQAGGPGAGVPNLGRSARYAHWSAVMRKAYATLQAQVERDEAPFMDEYGASDPAEFFAVATETFFIDAHRLKRLQPALYRELATLYELDPAAW